MQLTRHRRSQPQSNVRAGKLTRLVGNHLTFHNG